jgi:hypothetical protein
MLKVKLAHDVTSFEFEVESITNESLHDRYLRLVRERAAESQDGPEASPQGERDSTPQA